MAIKIIDIPGGITTIKDGVIVHQVNCMNKIGAGISGAFCKMYPKVESEYHSYCEANGSKGVFGTAQEVPVSDTLTIVNMFSQYGYGNPKKTGKMYTNYDAIVNCLTSLVRKHPNKTVYIPEYIGCGLGGGDWKTLCLLLDGIDVTVVKRPSNIK